MAVNYLADFLHRDDVTRVLQTHWLGGRQSLEILVSNLQHTTSTICLRILHDNNRSPVQIQLTARFFAAEGSCKSKRLSYFQCQKPDRNLDDNLTCSIMLSSDIQSFSNHFAKVFCLSQARFWAPIIWAFRNVTTHLGTRC